MAKELLKLCSRAVGEGVRFQKPFKGRENRRLPRLRFSPMFDEEKLAGHRDEQAQWPRFSAGNQPCG